MSGETTLPLVLPVMQFQQCLMNFLRNCVELHQHQTSVAAATCVRGQGVQTQAAAEGCTQLHPLSANKNKRKR